MRVRGRWNFYFDSWRPSGRASIRFDESVARKATPTTHRRCLRLIAMVPLHQVGHDGIPLPLAHVALRGFESDLYGLLPSDDHWLVGVMSHRGVREFVLQTNDVASIRAALPRLRAAAPFEVESQESAGWLFFRTRVVPGLGGRQQIRDRSKIARLVAAGSDLATAHTLEHRFTGPSDALDLVEAELCADRFQLVRTADDSLVVARTSSLDLEEVSGLTGRLASLARAEGARYDGWAPSRMTGTVTS